MTRIRAPRGHGTGARQASMMACVVAACALLHATAGLAQSSRPLVGVVRDPMANLGIIGVEVVVDGTTQRTITDEQGGFRFADRGAGEVTIRLRRLGYLPRTVKLGMPQGSEAISVLLTPAVQPLEAVQVRAERAKYTGRLAGFYERLERRTQGQFISRADLEREHPTQLTDLLQRNPGVRITRGRPGAQSVRLRGRDCRPLTWLDGAPMSSADVDLDSFSPTSLEGIEMYLGAASAPSRYQGVRGQGECGTILLWSRGPDTEPRHAAGSVTAEELEALIASVRIYPSEGVDEPAVLATGGTWDVPYPPSMRASGASGVVIAEFVVDTLGHLEPSNFGIVSTTHGLFSDSVRDAVRGALFRPARRGGRTVRQLVRQTFEFHPTSERR